MAQGILTTSLALSIYQFGDVYAYAREVSSGSFKFHLAFVPAPKMTPNDPTSWYSQSWVVSSYQVWYEGWSV